MDLANCSSSLHHALSVSSVELSRFILSQIATLLPFFKSVNLSQHKSILVEFAFLNAVMEFRLGLQFLGSVHVLGVLRILLRGTIFAGFDTSFPLDISPYFPHTTSLAFLEHRFNC